MYPQIFFSAHLDDVVLSCGGLIAGRKRDSRVLVASVFTGIGDAKTSRFGRDFMRSCGFSDAEALFLARKAEEVHASCVLGYDYAFLDCTDAMFRYRNSLFFRRYLYPDGCTAPLNDADIPLVAEVRQRVIGIIDSHAGAHTEIYFPLAIGGHADHQILNRIGLSLAGGERPKKGTVLFYEDFPYISWHGRAFTETQAPQYRQRTVRLTRQAFGKKLEAIASYRTQLHTLFGSESGFRRQMRVLSKAPAERYWSIPRQTIQP